MRCSSLINYKLVCGLFLAFFEPLIAAPLDDLKATKQLPDNPPALVWATPAGADADTIIEIGRITGSVGVMADDSPEAIAFAVDCAAKAQAKRTAGRAVVLVVGLRPWNKINATDPALDPLDAAMWKDVGKVRSQSKAVFSAIGQSAYKPRISVLINTEGLTCKTEPGKSACQDLYATYDFLVRYCYNPIQVEWYGWGFQSMPAEPDNWGQHAWAVPFDGLASIGFDLYRVGELWEKRLTSRKAVEYADSLGIVPVTPWISLGCGRVYTFDSKFHDWAWDAPLAYSRGLGEETYLKWCCDRPLRFMPCKRFGAVVFYPHPADKRAANGLEHFVEFVKSATK